VLTIAISIASGADAIFSFLPLIAQAYKLWAAAAAIGLLIMLNLRGVKESVVVLLPIFFAFLFTHAIVILYGIVAHLGTAPAVITASFRESQASLQDLGFLGMVLILLRAYSLGGGTYTGIEAVSNSMPILREPRVQTARSTMRYMAISLAFVASGLILCYLLWDVHPLEGGAKKTMNALLAEAFFEKWPIGRVLVFLTIASEACLLLVAAQTGFLGGPRVLVYMAFDRWVPSRFSNLSERLVTSNGVLFIGLSAGAVLLFTQGAVHILVVLYSINVFLTFALAQLGMCRDALHLRREGKPWRGPLFISLLGFVVTGSLLIGTVSFKFMEGGWATLLATGILCLVCGSIRQHYIRTGVSLRRLDESLSNVPLPSTEPTQAPLKRTAQTAILTVVGFGGLGIHSLLNLFRVFPHQFKQVVFVSVGAIDSGKFKGADEIEALRASTESDLQKYVDFARKLGLPAEYRYSIGTDIVDELEQLILKASEDFPRSVSFGGQLVFQKERSVLRWLHNQTCPALQRRLAFHGLPMVILPVRVY